MSDDGQTGTQDQGRYPDPAPASGAPDEMEFRIGYEMDGQGNLLKKPVLHHSADATLQPAPASGADAALTVTIPVAEFARLLDAIERIEAALTPPPPAGHEWRGMEHMCSECSPTPPPPAEPTLQAALAAVGLPETASVADLIRHHRNNEAAANGAWKLAYDALAAKSPAEPTLDVESELDAALLVESHLADIIAHETVLLDAADEVVHQARVVIGRPPGADDYNKLRGALREYAAILAARTAR